MKTKFINMLIIVLPIIACVLYSYTYYPGIITDDTASQWEQIQSNTFINWHSVWNTYIMLVCSKIYNSLSTVMFFQQFVYLLLIWYLSFRLYKANVDKAWVLLQSFIFSWFPLYAIMSVYLVKDFLFTIGFLLVMISLIFIIFMTTKVKRIDSIVLIIGTTLMTTQRQNGVFVVLFAGIVFGIYYLRTHDVNLLLICKTFIMISVMTFIITKLVLNIFNIPNAPKSEAMAVPLQIISANIKADNLTDEQLKLTSHIANSNDYIKENTVPSSVDILKFGGYFDSDYVNKHAVSYLKLACALTIKHFKTSVTAYYNQTKYIYVPMTHYAILNINSMPLYSSFDIQITNRRDGSMIPPIYFISEKTSKKYKINNRLKGFVFTNKKVDGCLNDFWLFLINNKFYSLIMTPAFSLYVSVSLIVFARFRIINQREMLVFITLPLILILSFAVSLPAPAYRYLYFTSFIPFLIINAVIVKKSSNLKMLKAFFLFDIDYHKCYSMFILNKGTTL